MLYGNILLTPLHCEGHYLLIFLLWYRNLHTARIFIYACLGTTSPMSSMSTTASQLSSILEGGNERRHVKPRSRTNSTRERERGPLGEERASAWSSNNSKKTELYEVPVIKLKR